MRVLLSAFSAQRQRTGISYYTDELVHGLRRLPDVDVVAWPPWWLQTYADLYYHQSHLYVEAAQRSGLIASLKEHTRGKALAVARRIVCDPTYEWWRQAFKRRLQRKRDCDLYHEPNYFPIECDVPTVVSVHDLTMLLYPQFQPAANIALFEKQFERGLKQAEHLIAISESGRQEIIRHLGWAPEKVSVTYMGVRQGLRPMPPRAIARTMSALKLKPGYLLHVGTLEPRKNLLMLLKAYSSLPRAIRERHPLVLAGGKGWNSDDIHDFLNTEGKHKGIVWLGYVDNKHFAALYSAARALLFPTFYEGFGMPTIEMMACGGAVIASTAGAVAETVGNQARLLDPHDIDGWRASMMRVCSDDDWWSELRRGAAAVAQRYTWERCAQQTVDAYKRMLANKSIAA